MNKLFFTRLYVASASPLSDLVDAVTRALGARPNSQTITTAVASAHVCTTDDFDRAAIERDPTDFIRYARAGAAVVASCDWEDLLPGEGKLGAVFEDAEIGKFLADPVPPNGAKGTT